MSHQLIYVCDNCGKEYTVDDSMEMPPYWFGVQIAIADKDGLIPPHEREIFDHFCCQTCFTKHSEGKEVRERKCIVDKKFDEDENG